MLQWPPTIKEVRDSEGSEIIRKKKKTCVKDVWNNDNDYMNLMLIKTVAPSTTYGHANISLKINQQYYNLKIF